MAKFGLKHKRRKYMCLNCGHVQEIGTNHTASCMDRCKECSWKPSWHKEGFIHHGYRPDGMRKFVYYNDSKKNLVAKYKDDDVGTFGGK